MVKAKESPLFAHSCKRRRFQSYESRFFSFWCSCCVWVVKSCCILNRWDSGSTVGDFDGHSKRVLSCVFKPTRPFRIVTCGEDFLVNFYEGPPFKFKQSLRFLLKHSDNFEPLMICSHFMYVCY